MIDTEKNQKKGLHIWFWHTKVHFYILKIPLFVVAMTTLTQESPLPWVVVKRATPIDFSRGITFSLKVPNRQVMCQQKAHKALFIPPVLVFSC